MLNGDRPVTTNQPIVIMTDGGSTRKTSTIPFQIRQSLGKATSEQKNLNL